MTKEKDYRQQSISRIVNQMNKLLMNKLLKGQKYYIVPGDFYELAKKIYDMLFPRKKDPINQ